MKSNTSSILALLMVALLTALSACSVPINTASGTKIDEAKVAMIKKGVTTRQQIEQLFGPPANVALMPDGRRTMSYTYTAVTGSAGAGFMAMSMSGNTSMRQESLQVILSKDGIVEDFEYNGSTQDSKMKNGIGGMHTESTTKK